MYDELYEAWKNEKDNKHEIQPLPKEFFIRLTQYFKRLKEESRMLDDKTVRARLLLEESKNAKMLSEELIRLRYEKALEKTKAGELVSAEGLSLEEGRLFKNVGVSTDAFANFLRDVLSGKIQDVKASDIEENPHRDVEFASGNTEIPSAVKLKSVLRFLQSVPGIIGADMKPYGPFKPEDVASVPVENAKVLIKQGFAAEVEVKP